MPARLKLYLLNLYFYMLFLLASAIAILVLTLGVACTRPFSSHRRTMKRFRRAISWYGKLITALPWPFIKLRYEDHAKNNAGEPYIFVCNHRSASDAFLMCVLPHECVQIVNVWPFRIPVIGMYAKLSGYLNIRMMSHEEFIETAGTLLNQGVSIIFFPEGTRSASRQMGSFHSAAFRLALDTKAAVVPLCISGNENIPPKGSMMLRPGTIRVRRLSAITWNEYKDLNAYAFKNQVWNIIDRELVKMEGQRGETADGR
ncbi:MAG TPA: lysophospholipid acyltransferase family protein [Nitrospirota bacterium]|nr:lysophospholipid acyltransferase family protein [Nitrospirota bacterium]